MNEHIRAVCALYFWAGATGRDMYYDIHEEAWRIFPNGHIEYAEFTVAEPIDFVKKFMENHPNRRF